MAELNNEQSVKDLFARVAGGVGNGSTPSLSNEDFSDLEALFRQYAGPSVEDLIRLQEGPTPTTETPATPAAESRPGLWDQTKAAAARFVEGFLYDKDLFDVDEEIKTPSWVTTGAQFMGHLTRELGLVFVSGGLVQIAKGLPWIARAVNWAGRFRNIKGASIVSTVIREGIEGGVYTGLSQVVAPEEFKPGVEGAVLNVAQFAAGGLGFRWAQGITRRVMPNAPGFLHRLAGLTGDTLFGASAAFGITGDPEMFTQQFGAELLAIALIDQLTYAISKGHVNDNAEVRRLLQKAEEARRTWEATGSRADEEQMWKAIEAAYILAAPDGATDAFADYLDQALSKDWLNDVRKVEAESARKVDQDALNQGATAAEAVASAREPAPRPAETARPEPRPAEERVRQTVQGPFTPEDIVRTFGYTSDAVERVRVQLPLITKWAEATGFDPKVLLALAKVESDFRDIDTSLKNVSDGTGPLQVTRTALKDLQQWKVRLENSFDTLEGRIEAGAKYLQLLRDRYGFQGDELIAAYFAGPTYIRKNGVTDTVIQGQISPREYVNRWKNAYMLLEQGVSPLNFDNPYVLQETLARLGYDVGEIDGIIGPKTREAIKAFQRDRGLEADGIVGPKTKAALEEAVNAAPSSRVQPDAARVGVESARPTEPQSQEPQLQPTLSPEPETSRVVEGSGEARQEVPRQAEAQDQSATKVEAQTVKPELRLSKELVYRNRRILWLGQLGKRFVQFESDELASLFDLGAELNRRQQGKSTRSKETVDVWEDRMASLLGVSKNDVKTIALDFRKLVIERAKKLNADGEMLLVTRDMDGVPEPVRKGVQEPEPPVRDPLREPERPSREPESEKPTRDPVREPEPSAREPEQPVGEPEQRVRDTEQVTRDPERTQEPEPPVRDSERTRDAEKPVRDTEQAVRDSEQPLREPEQPVREPDRLRVRQTVDEFDNLLYALFGFEHGPRSSTTAQATEAPPSQTPIRRSDAEIMERYQQRAKELEEWLLQHANKPLTEKELEDYRTKFRPRDGYSINTTRYDTSGEVLRVLKKFSDVLQDKSVQSLEEVAEGARKALQSEARSTAEQLGMVYEAVSVLEKVLQKAPELINSLRAINTAVASELQALAKKIATTGGDDLDLARFVELNEIMALLTGKFQNIQTQAGRTLGAFRVVVGDNWVDVSNLTPQDLLNSVDAREKVAAIIDAAGGKQAIVRKAQDILKAKDVPAIAETARKNALDQAWIRALVEQRQASILTNLHISMTNTASQLLNAIVEHATNFTAAGIGLLTFNRNRITFGEAATRLIYDVLGAVRAVFRPLVGLRDAVGMTRFKKDPSILDVLAMSLNPRGIEDLIRGTSFDSRVRVEGGRPQAMATSEILKETSLGRMLSKMPLSQVMWYFFDQAAAAQRALGFGMQELADRPFAYGAYFSELAGRLYRMRLHLPDKVSRKLLDGKDGFISKNEYIKQLYTMTLARRREKLMSNLITNRAMQSGLTGAELEAEIQRIRHEVTGGVLRDIPEHTLRLIDELDEAALAHSRYMTWKDPISNRFLLHLEEFMRRHPALRILVPFYHTPVKIVEKWAQSSGLGKKVWADIMGYNGRRARDLALARLAVSAALYAFGIHLAMNNLITPTARNESERRRMEEAGLPPNSIKIGDKWVQYTKLSPAPAMYLMTVANAYHLARTAEDDETALQIASEALFTIFKGVMDQPWLTGTRSFLNALQDLDRAQYYLEEFIETTVPFYGARQWASRTFEDYQKEVNTFVDRFLPKYDRLDTFGKKVHQSDYILGLRSTESSDSPIRQELVNLGYTLPGLEDTVFDVKLTEWEYWRMRRYMETGLRAEDQLNRLVQSPEYQAAPREEKIEMIRRLWTKLKNQARRWILNDPQVRKRYEETLRKKQSEAREYSYPFEWFERMYK